MGDRPPPYTPLCRWTSSPLSPLLLPSTPPPFPFPPLLSLPPLLPPPTECDSPIGVQKSGPPPPPPHDYEFQKAGDTLTGEAKFELSWQRRGAEKNVKVDGNMVSSMSRCVDGNEITIT